MEGALLLWFGAWAGGRVSQRRHDLTEEMRPDFSVILAASLTLLGLIIGFSFSMATARYDLRKTYEEAEANAIGTEYVRADLLGPAEASQVRSLLKQYTDLRIQTYQKHYWDDMTPINRQTAELQNQLWVAASQSAMARSRVWMTPSPPIYPN